MGAPVDVLFVCTANVCRSRAAEAVLAARVRPAGLADVVRVRSAGTQAWPGEPMCAQAVARVGSPARADGARELTAADLARADLVLALDRTHRSVCARLLPACRPRLFTLRHAAALADVVVATLAAGQVPPGSPPLPADRCARIGWLIAEFDAARGELAGAPDADADVVDRHGPDPHDAVFAEITDAVAALVDAFAAIASCRTSR